MKIKCVKTGEQCITLPRHSIGLLELQEEFIIQGIEVMEMKAQVF